MKSGLEYLLFGVSNPVCNFDPIHLNQIYPIVNDNGFFKKGLILISLRNLSTIILLDPDTGKVLFHQTGPWMNQHCVVQTKRSSIAVLDNHSLASGEYWLDPNWKTRILEHDLDLKTFNEVNLNKRMTSGL